jgi:hypothetical protein
MNEINKIKINNVDFISIGSYLDNNDGISYYYPREIDFKEWRNILNEESLLIKTWIIGNINYEFIQQNLDICFPEGLIQNIRSNISIINAFVEKYFVDEGIHLNDDFEDFIFGKFSEYGNGCEFLNNKISDDKLFYIENYNCKNEVYSLQFPLIPEWDAENGDYAITNKVFIKKDKLSSLLIDVDNIFEKLFN